MVDRREGWADIEWWETWQGGKCERATHFAKLTGRTLYENSLSTLSLALLQSPLTLVRAVPVASTCQLPSANGQNINLADQAKCSRCGYQSNDTQMQIGQLQQQPQLQQHSCLISKLQWEPKLTVPHFHLAWFWPTSCPHQRCKDADRD